MDCLDAFGRIISIEDVDDMGGSCFTYIRVSVSGLLSSDGHECTVAVGDTFIFSPFLVNTPLNIPSSPLLSDVSCLTHPVPYYRSFVGKGIEGKSGDRLLTCMRNFHLLPSLGLGNVIDTIGSGLLNFDMITDHALIPLTSTNIRLFTNGFVIEKMDTTCLPIIVSMLIHVETMWTVSAAEFLKETLKLTDGFVPELFEPDGVVIGFKLKSNHTHSSKFKNNDTEILGFNLDDMQNQYNMLDRALPNLSSEPTMIAFYVRNDSRGASTLLSTCKEWRQALRLVDIPEKRGVTSIPRSLLYSFLHAIDNWHCCHHENRLFDKSSIISWQDTIEFIDSIFKDKSKIKVPYGDISLKCINMLVEYQRLQTALNGNYTDHTTNNQKNPLCIVFGHAGSGIMHVGSQIVDRLNKRFKSPIRSYVLDFSSIIRYEISLNNFIASSLGTIKKGGISDFIVVTVIISPINYFQTTDIVDCISLYCNGFPVEVVSTI
jgi:hypothetical protein